MRGERGEGIHRLVRVLAPLLLPHGLEVAAGLEQRGGERARALGHLVVLRAARAHALALLLHHAAHHAPHALLKQKAPEAPHNVQPVLGNLHHVLLAWARARRVRLVRGEDETCLLSTGGGRDVSA